MRRSASQSHRPCQVEEANLIYRNMEFLPGFKLTCKVTHGGCGCLPPPPLPLPPPPLVYSSSGYLYKTNKGGC